MEQVRQPGNRAATEGTVRQGGQSTAIRKPQKKPHANSQGTRLVSCNGTVANRHRTQGTSSSPDTLPIAGEVLKVVQIPARAAFLPNQFALHLAG
ncbi:MAG: hypothetical protein AAGC84_14740, partial [Pseudomonas sp.]